MARQVRVRGWDAVRACMALHLGQQGASQRQGEVPAAARPARAGAVSGAPPDRYRRRHDALGHAGMGRPLCGSTAGAVLDRHRHARRPPDAEGRAAGAARPRGRGHAVGAPAWRRRADAQYQGAGPVGADPLSRRLRRPKVQRPAPDPGRRDHRGVWPGLPVPPPERGRETTGTASFCWRSNARRRGLRCASSRFGSGTGSRSRRNTMPVSGCTSASSAAGPAQGQSSSFTATWQRTGRDRHHPIPSALEYKRRLKPPKMRCDTPFGSQGSDIDNKRVSVSAVTSPRMTNKG